MPSWLGLAIAGTYAALFASFCGVVAARLPVRVGEAASDQPANAPALPGGGGLSPTDVSPLEPGSEWTTRPWLEAMRGRSRCDSCLAPIELWRNIPVVSWIWQRGKCAKCGARIPAETLAIEIVVPILVVAALAAGGWTWTTAGTCWLILLGAMVTQIDARTMMIPSKVLAVGWLGTVVTGALAVGYADAASRWAVASSALLGSAFGGIVLFALWWLTGGVGFGDVRLAGWLGAQIGLVVGAALTSERPTYRWAMTVMGSGIALMVAATIGLAWGFARGVRRGQAMPFGPFLVAGAVLVCILAPAVARAA